MSEEYVREIAEAVGGTITSMGRLPDGSGFATMSMPLPKTHWIYERGADGFSAPPPMCLRVGVGQALTVTMTREQLRVALWDAGKYAVRSATMNGAEMDFDPDALCQNLVVGMLGYFTEDGLSGDAWANPSTPWEAPPADPAVDPHAHVLESGPSASPSSSQAQP